MVAIGAIAGIALGLRSVAYVAPLLYQVRATGMFAIPAMVLLVAALAAAAPAVFRAVRIDPVKISRKSTAASCVDLILQVGLRKAK